MARKSNAVLSSEKNANFNDGGAATAAEFRSQQQDIIDSKAHLDVTDALSTQVAGKANTSHTHVLANITDAGTAAAANTGTGSGQVPLLDGDGDIPAGMLGKVPAGSANDRVHLTDTAVGPAIAGQPTLSEINAAKGANVDTVLYYTGTDTASDEPTHLYLVDASGTVTDFGGTLNIAEGQLYEGKADGTVAAVSPVCVLSVTGDDIDGINVTVSIDGTAITGLTGVTIGTGSPTSATAANIGTSGQVLRVVDTAAAVGAAPLGAMLVPFGFTVDSMTHQTDELHIRFRKTGAYS